MDRLRRKTGSGIWIHGSDEAMKHFDTEGCIRFENEYITYFREELNLTRTPVIVNHVLEWTDVATLRAEVAKIKSLINDWKDSWEKQILAPYLDFYSQEFVSHNQKMDYQQWVAHKERVFALGNTVRLTLTDFNYHYADNLLLITFMQDYRAGAYRDFGKKQMILRRDGSNWKIVQEEWTARR
jgi:murein L,D-transpeptidase YafK